MKDERLILVTNDDGITAPGIRALVEVARQFGKVVVVAPDSPQSGQGHSITLGKILRLKKVDIFDGIDAYQCSGTPVDCVKLAVHRVCDRKPDLCLSGINHGSNASINVIYSGTMGAAMEASFNAIDSIGFSFMEYDHSADFGAVKVWVKKVLEKALENGFPKSHLLNVNFPLIEKGPIKGIKLCHQGDSKWEEAFEEREDPWGRKYFWLTGHFKNSVLEENSDLAALDNGYISVVPVSHDLTAYDELAAMGKSWNK